MHRSDVVGHYHEDFLQISDTIYHCEDTLCLFAEPQGGQVSQAGHSELCFSHSTLSQFERVLSSLSNLTEDHFFNLRLNT